MHDTSIQALYINGPSSVGKTTLIHALQTLLLPTAYLRVSLDQIIVDMMPADFNDFRPYIVHPHSNDIQGFYCNFTHDTDGSILHVIERGPFAERMLVLFKQLALTTINSGFPIIIDDVAERGASDVARWRAALQGYNVLWIGLTAPLEVLEARERTRSNRAPGMSRAQFKVVHKGVDYDLFFDTDATSTATIADTIRTAIEQANAKNPVASL